MADDPVLTALAESQRLGGDQKTLKVIDNFYAKLRTLHTAIEEGKLRRNTLPAMKALVSVSVTGTDALVTLLSQTNNALRRAKATVLRLDSELATAEKDLDEYRGIKPDDDPSLRAFKELLDFSKRERRTE